MKIIHALSWYLPESSGGTEHYVAGLVRALGSRGIANTVVAAREGFESDAYAHEGVDVFRYPVHPQPNLKQIRGLVPYGGFENFKTWLAKQDADVYHQHSLIGGCSHHHLRAARELGFKTVLTVHLASAFCLRGTMMLHGEKPCDGEVRTTRCSECWGMSRGMHPAIARLVARVPSTFSESFSEGESPFASAFATRALVTAHQKRLTEIAATADRVVAISQWLHDALLLNGVAKAKLVLSPSGGPDTSVRENGFHRKAEGSLRVGYFGRWDKLKGVDLLVRAVRRLPSNLQIELTLHGLPGNGQELNYKHFVESEAGSDPRIKVASAVKQEEMASTLAKFDVVAIPSQLLETGPLIALEAHNARVPILASDLGGLSERVRHDEDGLLVKANDETEWTNALTRLVTERGLLERLRKGIRPIRTMQDVASDMVAVYQQVTEREASINAA